jgi:hypothetical protein
MKKRENIIFFGSIVFAYILLKNDNKSHRIAGMGEIIDEPEYLQFRGKWKEAIAYLQIVQKGIAVAALYHPKIGEIDLVWGFYKNDKRGSGHGLVKIIAKHPEALENMQPILLKMTVKYINKTVGYNLKGYGYKGNVRLIHNGEQRRWLMTLFEKE